LTVRKPESFNDFKFIDCKPLKSIEFTDLEKLYTINTSLLVRGGRKCGLEKLNNLKNHKTYKENRDILT